MDVLYLTLTDSINKIPYLKSVWFKKKTKTNKKKNLVKLEQELENRSVQSI